MERRSFHGMSNCPIQHRTSTTRMSQPSLESVLINRCRIVVLGAAKVGKTAIIQQFVFNQFIRKHEKNVEDLFVAEYSLPNGNSSTLEILDTTGSYEFPAMRSLAISNGDAFILVYSVDDAESWQQIIVLRNQVIEARDRDIPIVIVANKSDEYDIERAVERDVIENTMMCWGGAHIDCSAKENTNIIQIFDRVLLKLNIPFTPGSN